MTDFFYGTSPAGIGTITVTNGSTTFTGQDVNFQAYARAGDWLLVGGVLGIVSSVTSLLQGEFTVSWPGEDGEEVPFLLLPGRVSSSPRALSAALEAYREELRRLGKEASAIIASAAVIELAAADGDLVEITGTETIEAMGGASLRAGACRVLVFAAAATLEHGAAIILPGAVDFEAAAGDAVTMRHLGAGVWKRVA